MNFQFKFHHWIIMFMILFIIHVIVSFSTIRQTITSPPFLLEPGIRGIFWFVLARMLGCNAIEGLIVVIVISIIYIIIKKIENHKRKSKS